MLYAGVTIVWCISTALLFLDIFFAKRAEPERFERERRVPTGFLFLCGAVGFVVNILAVLFIFVGSWYPKSDANPTGWELADWNVWMVGFTLASVVSGIVIYLISQQTRRGRTDEELIGEGAAEQEIAEDLPPPRPPDGRRHGRRRADAAGAHPSSRNPCRRRQASPRTSVPRSRASAWVRWSRSTSLARTRSSDVLARIADTQNASGSPASSDP